VVFALEELAKRFERRTHTTVILVVVTAGLASYTLQGDYSYFGVLASGPALGSAWLAAPVIGIVCGLVGSLFSRAIVETIGPADNRLSSWRRARPVVFAGLCGLIAATVAWLSGGATYGAGYAQAQSMLQGEAGQGLGFAAAKFVASLAAAVSGAPGGIFAPALATGAGLGVMFAHLGLQIAGRDAVVLGMAAYLSGVVQAPLTSAVILMEMTRDPSLVGPLMLAALAARWSSGLLMKESVYHVLARNWLPPGR